MSTVIEEVVIDLTGRTDEHLSLFNPESYRVSLRGFATDIFNRTTRDGNIIKSSGLESITSDVQGGSVFYGGSAFTGSRPQDREVVLTVIPHDGNSMKAKLNRLIAMSSKQPLTMSLMVRVHYPSGQSALVRHTAHGYLSDVTSPIFDKSPEIQITMKLGDPTFQQDRVIYSESIARGDTITYSNGTSPTNGWYTRESSFNMGDGKYLHTAPGSFRVTIKIMKSMLATLREVRITDSNQSMLRWRPNDTWRTNNVEDYIRLLFDGFNRTFLISFDTGVFKNDVVGFHYTTHGGWPEFRPGSPEFHVSVDSTFQSARHELTSVYYQTGAYGF